MSKIPQTENKSIGSENNTTLKIVADIGSRMLSADAVPTGICLSAIAYRKYGEMQVKIPMLIERAAAVIGFATKISENCEMLQVKIPINVATKKQ